MAVGERAICAGAVAGIAPPEAEATVTQTGPSPLRISCDATKLAEGLEPVAVKLIINVYKGIRKTGLFSSSSCVP